MNFIDTSLPGVLIVEPERHSDERGHFARTWCREAFFEAGLELDFSQCSTSYNRERHTLRGLHFQAAPYEEAKLLRCTRGAAFDVVADVRPSSPTYGRWVSVEISAENGRMVFIPEGYAHGFQTLEDDTEIFYQITQSFVPEAACGIRWDDPDLAIDWPSPMPSVISARDEALPRLADTLGGEMALREKRYA